MRDQRNTMQPTECMMKGHDFGVTIMVQDGKPVGKTWKEFCRRCGARSCEAKSCKIPLILS
jgi:hypothetical protein